MFCFSEYSSEPNVDIVLNTASLPHDSFSRPPMQESLLKDNSRPSVERTGSENHHDHDHHHSLLVPSKQISLKLNSEQLRCDVGDKLVVEVSDSYQTPL